jgi:putative ABC transport system permease protein
VTHPDFAGLIADVRAGFRALTRHRATSAIIVFTLALGIGLSITVYTIVDAVLIRALPFENPDELVAVWRALPANRTMKTMDSYADFDDWRANAKTIESMGALTWVRASRAWRTPSGELRDVLAPAASVDLFDVLGARASHGRTFAAADLNSGCVVVLSHGFWANALGGDTRPIGSSIQLDGASCVVRGVMPADFALYPAGAEMWTLMQPTDPLIARDPAGYPTGVFARLKPGFSASSAEQELTTLYERRRAANPAMPEFVPLVFPLRGELVFLAGPTLRSTLMTLIAAVGCVLLIACMNVANLLLGKALSRRREFMVRLALGSGPRRLARHVIGEGLALSIAGSAAGLAFAWCALWYLRVAAPVTLPATTGRLDINANVAVVAVGLAVFTALFFSAVPAWHAARTGSVTPMSGARTGQSRSERTSARALVAVEIALSVMLLVGATLMISSMQKLGAAPLGFRTDRMLTFRVALPRAKYATGVQSRIRISEMISALRGLPGVEGAAAGSSVPALGGGGFRTLATEGDAIADVERRHDVLEQVVTPEYFAVHAETILAGRTLTDADRADVEQVAVINASLARGYFGAGPAVGKRIRIADRGPDEPWIRIVGVVADERRTRASGDIGWGTDAMIFRPLGQRDALAMYFAVAARSNPSALAEPARRALLAIERDAVISDVRTMEDRVGAALSYPRFRARVIGVFAALSLLLAAVGLYGVLSQLVAQRSREIGIRMAVGAQRRNVIMVVLRETLLIASIGLMAGAAGTLLMTRLLQGFLYGVAATDAAVIASVNVGLVITALVASLVPARRAAAIDPAIAFRAE